VSHEDVLPYKTTEGQPIHNHLFDKFLDHDTDLGKSALKIMSSETYSTYRKLQIMIFVISEFVC